MSANYPEVPIALLTRRETAQRLHVSFSTVLRLGAEGKITEVQVSKRGVRIDSDSVDAHLQAGRRQPAAGDGR